jgi:chorismate mutase
MISTDLSLVAAQLEGLEETIIHRLIDRAQFCANAPAYAPGASGFAGEKEASLFELRLRKQEEMDAEFGRFEVPEERPFHHDLPEARRKVRLPELPLSLDDYGRIGLTGEIVEGYLEHLNDIAREGDDGQYGSAVEHDVAAIQAIARRIHYGSLYVAESKYRKDPEGLQELVDREEREHLLEKLTRPEVESAILERVSAKVSFIQERVNLRVRFRLSPEPVLGLYRDLIIPLTKEGQVRYLFHRRP